MNTAPSQLPSEFFSTKSLFTLSGSAGAVWLFCLVLSTLIPANTLSVYYWRLIALLCSESLAVIIIWQQRGNSLKKWLVGIFNGLLIFINASGINAVSTGLAFENRDNIKTESAFYYPGNKMQIAAIFPFNHEINWWPDRKLLHKKDSLEKSNEHLKNENAHIKVLYSNLNEKLLKETNNTDCSKRDSLLSVQVQKLQKDNADLKDRLKYAGASRLPSNQGVKSESTNNELSQLKKEIADCQKEKSEMKKK